MSGGTTHGDGLLAVWICLLAGILLDYDKAAEKNLKFLHGHWILFWSLISRTSFVKISYSELLKCLSVFINWPNNAAMRCVGV